MSTYTYKKIAELEQSPQMQNFYGKIIFYGKEGDRLVLLVKDETDLLYVWVKPKENQILRFGLKQIVRFHRAIIGKSMVGKHAVVTIGKAGCHLVAWPFSGKPEKPAVISSKTWTKSTEDQERLKTLSELDSAGPATTAESFGKKLIAVREAQRARVVVANWLSSARNEDLIRRNGAAMELLEKMPGAEVDTNYSFPVDRTYFDEPNPIQFIQFFSRCRICFDRTKEVRYAQHDTTRRCFDCRKNLKDLELAFRIRIDVENINLVFTIPLQILPGFEKLPSITIADCKDVLMSNELTPKFGEFMKSIRRKFWSSAIGDIRGQVTGRAESLNYVEIFAYNATFRSLN